MEILAFYKMCRSVEFTHTLTNIDILIALIELLLMRHDWTKHIYDLTLCAIPEKCIKIYVYIKKLGHFNHTFERKQKFEYFACMRYKFFSHFYHIKITISLDLIKILL